MNGKLIPIDAIKRCEDELRWAFLVTRHALHEHLGNLLEAQAELATLQALVDQYRIDLDATIIELSAH